LSGAFLCHLASVLIKISQLIGFGIIIAVGKFPNRSNQASMITAHEATANHSIYT
jgi:hypothetical protein